MRQFIFFLSLFPLCIGILWMGWSFTNPSSQDKEKYLQLIEASGYADTSGSFDFGQSQLERVGVKKDFWFFSKENHEAQFHIEADEALIGFQEGDKHPELIEKMEGIRGWLRERDFYTFEGDSALLSYSKQVVDANTVIVGCKENFICHANSLSFSLDDQVLQLREAILEKPEVGTIFGKTVQMDQNRKILIKDDVSLQSRFGPLTCDSMEWDFTTEILTMQRPSLFFYPERSLSLNRLICPGRGLIDHRNKKISLFTDQDSDSQICFEDKNGRVHTDFSEIDYSMAGDHYHIENVRLRGNIQLARRFSITPESDGAFIQYLLAHDIFWTPYTGEMQVFGVEKEPVIFFDRATQIQMAAPSVLISRDSGNGKEKVKGNGDVRFRLSDTEFKKLKTHFAWKQ